MVTSDAGKRSTETQWSLNERIQINSIAIMPINLLEEQTTPNANSFIYGGYVELCSNQMELYAQLNIHLIVITLLLGTSAI